MANFDYGNARLRAMKSRLISHQELVSLADSENLTELISGLSRTDYKKQIESALATSIGMECINIALSNAIVHTLRSITSFYEGEALQMVRIILGRYDIENLKVVLRGLSNNVRSSEIQAALTPLGELPPKILEQLTRLSGLREAIDVMASMNLVYAQPLIRLRTQRPGASIFEMEVALEKWYLDKSLEEIKTLSAEREDLETLLKLEADHLNLLTILRAIHEPDGFQRLEAIIGKINDLFVGPGFLNIVWLQEYIQADQMEELLEGLSGTRYQETFIAGMDAYKRSGKISDIERGLICHRVKWAKKLIYQKPLSIGVVIGYISLKVQELRNLRWIAQGVNMNMKSTDIKAQLEYCG